jgi:hypothetical protein
MVVPAAVLALVESLLVERSADEAGL